MVATIGDVARLAGVSRSTASYAFSGRRPISTGVRERVTEAAAALGYTPHAGAQALATARTNGIGVLAEFLPGEYPAALFEYILAVTSAAQRLGFHVVLSTEPDSVEALRRMASTSLVDGFVLLNVPVEDQRIPVLQQSTRPGVLIGIPENLHGIDAIDLDFEEAARMMVEHLYGLGHRVAILLSSPVDPTRGGAYAQRFRTAAQSAAREFGMLLHLAAGAGAADHADQVINGVLDAHPEATGLLVHDVATLRLASVLQARGTSVPEDLSVIGVFSQEHARTFSLPFTAIDPTPNRIGDLAVRRLVERISDDKKAYAPHSVRLVLPTLIDRGSTAPPRRPPR